MQAAGGHNPLIDLNFDPPRDPLRITRNQSETVNNINILKYFFSMFIGFVIFMLELYYRHYRGSPAR